MWVRFNKVYIYEEFSRKGWILVATFRSGVRADEHAKRLIVDGEKKVLVVDGNGAVSAFDSSQRERFRSMLGGG